MPNPAAHQLRGAEAIVASLPEVFGAFPDDSFVLCTIAADGTLGSSMTAKLPADPSSWDAMIREMTDHLIEREAARGFLVPQIAAAVCPAADQPEYDEAARHTHQALTHHLNTISRTRSLPLLEVLYVTPTRWWSALCSGPACCPPGGRDVPTGPDGRPWPAKSELLASLAPFREPDATEHRQAIRREHQGLIEKFEVQGPHAFQQYGRNLLADTIRGVAAGYTPDGLGSDITARLALLLQSRVIHADVLLYLDPVNLKATQALCRTLARVCVEPYTNYAGVILALHALASWGVGDLPTARLSLEAANEVDPGNALAELLYDNIVAGAEFEVLHRVGDALKSLESHG
ncbi:DUF4192 domain-containing protein [Kitasatospora sp. NPDC096147]|uniref:DUF4192 domain-containing protein n=1 Tax=Kitasatospora sp. NPDC096147 TaxID=3364093 RepID=UPI003823453F